MHLAINYSLVPELLEIIIWPLSIIVVIALCDVLSYHTFIACIRHGLSIAIVQYSHTSVIGAEGSKAKVIYPH